MHAPFPASSTLRLARELFLPASARCAPLVSVGWKSKVGLPRRLAKQETINCWTHHFLDFESWSFNCTRAHPKGAFQVFLRHRFPASASLIAFCLKDGQMTARASEPEVGAHIQLNTSTFRHRLFTSTSSTSSTSSTHLQHSLSFTTFSQLPTQHGTALPSLPWSWAKFGQPRPSKSSAGSNVPRHDLTT